MRETYRLAPPVVLWWVWLAFVAANVADWAVQGTSAGLALTVGAIMLAVTGAVYALALRPRVVADEEGITVLNPFRDHRVPWTAVRDVDTAEWVRVRYRAGADDKILHCWALYVSARARRKIARGPSRPRRRLLAGGFGAPVAENSRLPEEARHLASLPMAQAVATRLDARAGRERARAGGSGQGPGPAAAASWSWPALTAAVVPALVLLVVVLA